MVKHPRSYFEISNVAAGRNLEFERNLP